MTSLAELAQGAGDELLAMKSLIADLTRRSFAEVECQLAPRLCDPMKFAIDVGANSGIYTTIFARGCAGVLAVEPNPRLATHLRRKFRLFRNVRIIEAALSAKGGEATLKVPLCDAGLASLNSSTLAHHSGVVSEISVATMTLDEIAERPVGIVKIDVEGHEGEVLHGATQTLRTDRPVLIVEAEERHRAGAVRELIDTLGGLDYRGWFVLGESVHSITEFRAAVHQDYNPRRIPAFGSPYVNNFIFLPGERRGNLTFRIDG